VSRGNQHDKWHKKSRDQANIVSTTCSTGNCDSGSDYSLAVKNGEEKSPAIIIQLVGIDIKMIIDSETSVNTVDVRTHHKLCEHSKKVYKLSKLDTKLFPYAFTKALDLKGTFSATITSPKNGVEFDDEFYVMIDAKGCLLSYDTAK